jgi:DNA-binding MarR family transcriptional regulator
LELARRSDKTEVSTLNLLKKLEINGMVIRRPDPVDGRSRRVYLTSKGRKLQKTLIPMAQGNIRKMTEGLEERDIDLLKTTLRKITDNLKNK